MSRRKRRRPDAVEGEGRPGDIAERRDDYRAGCEISASLGPDLRLKNQPLDGPAAVFAARDGQGGVVGS